MKFKLLITVMGLVGGLIFGTKSESQTQSQSQSNNRSSEEYLNLIKVIKKSGVSHESLSMYLTLTNGLKNQVLLDINSHKVLIPASISKLATSLAVLRKLEPGYKFKTQLLVDSLGRDGVIKGPLYLKGGGDPSFTSENMWYLVNIFLRSGIKKVDGDIIVDDSLFDRKRFDPTRQSERVDRAYDAPVGAMSFNWNSINIFVRPGEKKGDAAQVFLDPLNEYAHLINKTKTVDGDSSTLSAERKEGETIIVSGKIGLRSTEKTIYKNISYPDIWSGTNLKEFLSQRGVIVTGTVKNGITPGNAILVAENESKDIQNILADMNKFSNNYVAEMLIKNIACLKSKPGTLETGMIVVNEVLQEIGLPANEYFIQNPSGLTRENRISSLAMWKILSSMKDDFSLYPELLTSLPIAGIDGTLKKRMKNSPGERWVRAKTGFLTNVVALAGFAGRRDGSVLTFSFIFNGSVDEGKVRSLFDEILIEAIKP